MSAEKSLISVILPVKDADLTKLEAAVASVREQTWPEYELCIADDGSSKAFAEELDKRYAKDERIRIFHRKGAGVSAARNFAIKEAGGDIITFLDDDDILSRVCFEEAAAILEDPCLDAVWGGTVYIPEEERGGICRQVSGCDDRAAKREELLSLCEELSPERIHQTRAECMGEPYRFENNGYINRGIAARFIKKKSLVEKAHFFPEDLKMFEDTIWNLRMMDDLRMYYVKRVWYYYFDNKSSASNRFREDFADDSERALEKMLMIIDTENEVEYKAYSRFLIDALRYVYNCLLGHADWNASREEKNELKRHLYNDAPWDEIGTKRFKDAADKNDALKALLYRLRLLFFYWKIR